MVRLREDSCFTAQGASLGGGGIPSPLSLWVNWFVDVPFLILHPQALARMHVLLTAVSFVLGFPRWLGAESPSPIEKRKGVVCLSLLVDRERKATGDGPSRDSFVLWHLAKLRSYRL